MSTSTYDTTEPVFEIINNGSFQESDNGNRKIQYMKDKLDGIRNGTFSGTPAKFRKWKKCIYKFHSNNPDACYEAELICDTAEKLLISYKQPNDRFSESLTQLFETPYTNSFILKKWKRVGVVEKQIEEYRALLARKRDYILSKLAKAGAITDDEAVRASQLMRGGDFLMPSDYPLSLSERRGLFPSVTEDKIAELQIEPDIMTIMMGKLIPWVISGNTHKVWFTRRDGSNDIVDFEVTHFGLYLFRNAYADNVSYWARNIMSLLKRHSECQLVCASLITVKRLCVALGQLRVSCGGQVQALFQDMLNNSMYQDIHTDIRTQLTLFNRENICKGRPSEKERVRLAKIQILLGHNNEHYIRNLPIDKKVEYLLERHEDLYSADETRP